MGSFQHCLARNQDLRSIALCAQNIEISWKVHRISFRRRGSYQIIFTYFRKFCSMWRKTTRILSGKRPCVRTKRTRSILLPDKTRITCRCSISSSIMLKMEDTQWWLSRYWVKTYSVWSRNTTTGVCQSRLCARYAAKRWWDLIICTVFVESYILIWSQKM